jgi:acetyl esterase/lipase
MKLPPAFFTCGTDDPLLDDSVLFSTKWLMAGGQAILRIYPGEFSILWTRAMITVTDLADY